MDFTARKPTREMWHVDVWQGGQRFLTVGHNQLSGDEITPEREEVVRTAAQHLLSFIGARSHAPDESTPQTQVAGAAAENQILRQALQTFADAPPFELPIRHIRGVAQRALIDAQIARLVSDFFKGDTAKVELWFWSPNPNFGNIAPQELIRLGQQQKVLDFVLNAREAELAAGAAQRPIEVSRSVDEIARLRGRVAELEALINNPQTENFLEAVKIEAAHQRERWTAEGTAGKTDADWFWLLGYLAGKAISKPQKILHHIITTAAACLNWHLQKVGYSTSMRPGIQTPVGEPE